MNIYVDESGNTGQNLLDISQPMYVLASHNFSKIETKEILTPLTSVGKEFHFKSLKKSYKYQQQLIKVLNNDFIQGNRIKYYFIDKRFALTCQIVDLLIEPVLYINNIDIYKKGLNIAYSNILHHFGNHHWDKGIFNQVLNDFQIMIRNPVTTKYTDFYKSLYLLNDTLNFEEKTLLKPIIESESLIIDIIHDDSKQISFWQEYIDFHVKVIKDSPKEVGYDYRKINYPLPINSIKFEKSHLSIQIQLADIIASSISYCLKKRHIEQDLSDKFASLIFKTQITKIISYPLMPSMKFTPTELGTTDDKGVNPLDYLAELAKKHNSKYEQIMSKIIR